MTPPISASASDSPRTETSTGTRVEPERAQRRDFSRARRDRRVHRQDRAEHGADAHQRRDAEADRAESARVSVRDCAA